MESKNKKEKDKSNIHYHNGDTAWRELMSIKKPTVKKNWPENIFEDIIKEKFSEIN